MPNINFKKTPDQSSSERQSSLNPESASKTKEMEISIGELCNMLEKPSADFNRDLALEHLYNYTKNYERISYSTITGRIYHYHKLRDPNSTVATMLSNLEDLSRYLEDWSPNASNKFDQQIFEKTKLSILKILDHINLATAQYAMLTFSDEEYDEKFNNHIASFKEEITKEINAQMLTMIGIFTALAFLIFGSISSLDGIFENLEMPLFKVMSIGLIWGLCVSNMIFIFLYCIGRMTKLNPFGSADKNIFQQFALVWWTNLILISLLMFSCWGWFLQKSEFVNSMIKLTNCKPVTVAIIGGLFIVALIVAVATLLRWQIAPKQNRKKTKKFICPYSTTSKQD